MRRVVAVLVAAGAMALGAAAGTASADVHGVTRADCGLSENAGATRSHDAPGRPPAPIPVSASDGRTQGMANDAPAQGPFCD
jgi:hypothetical protein